MRTIVPPSVSHFTERDPQNPNYILLQEGTNERKNKNILAKITPSISNNADHGKN